MTDIVERLRDWQDYEPVKMFAAEMLPGLEEAAAEIERLRGENERLRGHIYASNRPQPEDFERLRNAIQRIDGINDNPAHFNKAINDVCNTILRPELVDNARR